MDFNDRMIDGDDILSSLIFCIPSIVSYAAIKACRIDIHTQNNPLKSLHS